MGSSAHGNTWQSLRSGDRFPLSNWVSGSPGEVSWLPEYDAFLLLWVFHHALPTGSVEFLLVDVSVIACIDLRKVHDIGSGICLR